MVEKKVIEDKKGKQIGAKNNTQDWDDEDSENSYDSEEPAEDANWDFDDDNYEEDFEL